MGFLGITIDPTEDSGIGLTNLLFFGISGIVILLFFLNSAESCGDSFKFCSIVIFSSTLIYSFVWIILLGIVLKGVRGTERSFGGQNSVEFQFMQELTLPKLLIIIPALLGVFFISWFSVQDNVAQPLDAIGIPHELLGIFGSGLILSSLFLVTKTGIPSTIAHGIYNMTVVYLVSSGSLNVLFGLSQSPIKVPEIGVTFFDNVLLSEMLGQMFLIAPAEEFFRIFVIFLFMIVINARWDPNSIKAKIGAMFIAVGLWSIYHLPIALQ